MLKIEVIFLVRSNFLVLAKNYQYQVDDLGNWLRFAGETRSFSGGISILSPARANQKLAKPSKSAEF